MNLDALPQMTDTTTGVSPEDVIALIREREAALRREEANLLAANAKKLAVLRLAERIFEKLVVADLQRDDCHIGEQGAVGIAQDAVWAALDFFDSAEEHYNNSEDPRCSS